MRRSIFIFLILVLTTTSCASASVSESVKAELTRAPATTRAPTTTVELSFSCSLEYEGRDLVRDWNGISSELLASYIDLSVSIEQYLEDSDRLVPQLSQVVYDMRDLPDCLPLQERDVFIPLLATYNDKLSGYEALENSLRIESVELEEVAIEMLMLANEESMAMACEIARLSGTYLPGFNQC